MTKSRQTLSNEDYIRLLEEGRYEEIFSDCQDFIKRKVEAYLRHFQYYNQYSKDFLHEVYIHLLTKSFPSHAFLTACKNGNHFKFYLAKSIKNILNTQLSKEKGKKQNFVEIEDFYGNQEESNIQDTSAIFEDKTFKEQAESQDLLHQLKNKFETFLKSFLETFPKIGFKLILLLKLMARVRLSEIDIKNCFKDIQAKEIQNFLDDLGDDQIYAQREDIEIYDLIYPYFQTYRNENGSPAALQRWLNEQLTGKRGILDRLEIKDKIHTFKITDKKLFYDFLHICFKPSLEVKTTQTVELEKETFKAPVLQVVKNQLHIVAQVRNIR